MKENLLYVLHYKGQLIGTFDWKRGGTTGLYGWRPPKKVYFTIGQARRGVSHLPKDMIDDIEIIEYLPGKVVERSSLRELEIKKLKRREAAIKKGLEHVKTQNQSWMKDYKINYEKELVEIRLALTKLTGL